MVWSPLSNFMLYGQTANVKLAKQHGVPIALGSDWSPSGSKNLLHELKIAKVANEVNRYGFSDADIVGLATSNAAAIVKWNAQVGSLEAGKRADIVVISAPASADPYSAIISARESDVHLVLIDGNAVVGTPALMKAMGATGESMTVGGARRNIDYGKPDPEIAPLSYRQAVQVLTHALAELPTIPTAPPRVLHDLSARLKHRWTLALDEQHDTGFALRPMLPLHGEPTGPDVSRIDQAHVDAAPIGPVPLDKASVPDDHEYAANLNAQINIPQNIKDGLRAYYPI
jgi:5-methylthioadenosine/S-adenosylhomocysteine deaminase